MTWRSMTRGWSAAMVLLSAGAASAHAQTTPPQRTGLTVDELVAFALEHSPRLAAARERVEVARGDLTQAGLRSNPEVMFSQAEQIAGGDRQISAEIGIPLDLFRRGARRDTASRAVDAAVVDAVRVDWDLASRVRAEAGRLLAAERMLELARDQSASARVFLNLVAAAAEGGAVPRLDRDIADVDARRLEAAASRLAGEAAALRLSLKALVGMDPGAPLELRVSLENEVDAIVAAGESLTDVRTPNRRPDVLGLDAAIAMASADRERLRREGHVDLRLSAGFMRTEAGFPQFGLLESGAAAPIMGRFNMITFGATVMLPWSNRNQGAIAAASARARSLTRERDAAVLEADAEAQSARARLAAARATAAIYMGGLRELASRNLAVLQETYRLGRAPLTDVLAERRRLLDLESEYTSALLDIYDAEVALRRALGVTR